MIENIKLKFEVVDDEDFLYDEFELDRQNSFEVEFVSSGSGFYKNQLWCEFRDTEYCSSFLLIGEDYLRVGFELFIKDGEYKIIPKCEMHNEKKREGYNRQLVKAFNKDKKFREWCIKKAGYSYWFLVKEEKKYYIF